MAPACSKQPIEIPVRHLEILERDGRRVRALRVFCPRRHASVQASTCTTCFFARAATDTAVTCMPPGMPEVRTSGPDAAIFLGPDAVALRTAVGAVCALRSVAIRVDVPIADARRLLDREAIVVVLTSDNQVHGILSPTTPLDGLTALAETGDSTSALAESAPLTEAIELMVHRRVRIVSVTGNDRQFTGLVTDLDLLRWVARIR